MDHAIALTAAFMAMVANGSAVILEKIGVDQQPKSRQEGLPLVFGLATNPAYIGGLVLDIVGWLLTLVALKLLPLYLVQSIIAANIVVTAMLDQFMLKLHMPRRGYGMIALVLGGLFMLAAATPAQEVGHVLPNDYVYIGLGMLVVVLGLGFAALRLPKRLSAIALAATSGIAFGAVSIAARALVSSLTITQFIINPLTYVLITGSLLGLIWFTIALQRANATMTNAITLSVQTIAPAILGIVLLDDNIKPGALPVIIVALTITLIGSLALGAIHNNVKPKARTRRRTT